MVDRGAKDEGRLLATDFPGPDDAAHLLAFNARGTRLAVGWDHRAADRVLVFDPRSGREVARLEHLPFVSSLAFLSSEVLLIGQQHHYQGEKQRPGRCVRCDLRRGSREIVLEQKDLRNVAVSPNGRVVAMSEGAGLVLYDAARWQVRHRLTPLYGYGGAWNTVFSCGGRYVAASLYGSHGDLIAVWSAQDGRRQRTFEAAQCARVLGFCEDTLTLAVGGSHDNLLLYEENQGEEPAAIYRLEDYARAVQFHGRTLAVLLDSGGVCFLQADTGRAQKRVLPPADHVLRYAEASADWSLVAAAVAGGVFVWKGA
jgi:WD40 repeat protein